MWCMKHKNHVQKYTTKVMQVHVLDTWETLHTKFCYFFAHLDFGEFFLSSFHLFSVIGTIAVIAILYVC